MTTVLDTTTVPGAPLLYRLALLLAAVSGAFCIAFLSIIAINYHGLLSPHQAAVANETETVPLSDPSYRQPAEDSFNRLPTDYQSILILRQALAQDRQNEELKSQIRQLDHELRIGYFQRRLNIHRSSHLLVVSSFLFFAAIWTTNVLKRQIPTPNETSRRQNKQKGSWHLTLLLSWFMLCAGLFLGILLAPPSSMDRLFREKLAAHSVAGISEQAGMPAITPGQNADAELPVETPLEPVTLTEELLAKNWVSFRNFDGNGVGFSDNPPLRWDGRTGENIVWKSEVPLPGNSSPVIWENKLFLTGADENTQKIFCYNIENGELLWEKDVTRPEAKISDIEEDTGYAAPTPVVDGRHVYAMFANGELVAVDFNGKFIWRKSFGIPDNHYGFASSPALFFDRLIVQFDDGDGSEGNSKLLALNLSTGDVLWETLREEIPNSWASPTIKKIGDSYQIITCANPFVIAYNPENGEEIWRCKCLGGDVGPSAVSLENVVLITNQSPRTSAVDATGSGDVTATHILWVAANTSPDTPSPLATEEYFLTLDSAGYLSGYNPKEVTANKRAKYWELEIGDGANFYSSPLRVGTYIYAFDKTKGNARAFVIDLAKIAVGDDGSLTEESAAAMRLAENPMPEPCVTSPAILNNRLYIRGETAVYCIGEH